MNVLDIEEWGLSVTSQGLEFFSEVLCDAKATGTGREQIKRYLLECDFRQIPEGSFTETSTFLPPQGNLIVQLVKAIDVSRPVGPEDEDGSDSDEEEQEGEVKYQRVSKGGKRMLRLTLATPGGASRVDALEVSRQQHLPEIIIPGAKFILKGPLRMVAGFIALESTDSIKPVGGGVKRLTDSFKQNQDVKARRKDLNHEHGSSENGPPKFISFLDMKKAPKRKETKNAAKVVSESSTDKDGIGESKPEAPTRTVDHTHISDKAKELESAAKLSADAFAMKAKKGKGQPRRERTSRRDRDELLEQYKPPSRTAPQVVLRLDKISNLEDAQRIHDEVHTQNYSAQDSQRGKGFSRGKGSRGADGPSESGRGKGSSGGKGQRGKGKGKGKGRPY